MRNHNNSCRIDKNYLFKKAKIVHGKNLNQNYIFEKLSDFQEI